MAREAYSTRTRQRLLDAACKIFAEHGFEGASIRQIAAAAEANIAAVNYHFGNKEALYKEVVEVTFRDFNLDFTTELSEFDFGSPSPEQIRQFAKARILTGVRAKRHFPPRLLGWEILAPRFGLKAMMEERLEATEARFMLFLAPLLSPALPAEQRAIAARWFLVATLPPPPVALGLRKQFGDQPESDDLARAVDGLASAAIAGVTAFGGTA